MSQPPTSPPTDPPPTARSVAAVGGLLLLALLSACGDATEGPTAEGDEPGRLVVIGGGLSQDNEAVYRAILEGREGEGPICVIPTAGASPRSSMESAVERIDRWGSAGTARGVFISTENPESARDPEVVSELEGCGGFFFTGGVQSRIVDVFRPDGEDSPAYGALLSRWRTGAVVAGTSAGAAMMSHPMLAGGDSETAWAEGVEEGVRLERGMAFLPGLLVDQHFLARGRIGRLMAAVVHGEDFDLGAGVDENTALVVDGDRGWVVGASGVVLVEAAEGVGAEGADHLVSDDAGGERVGALRIHLLGAADTVVFGRREVRTAADKRPVAELRGSGRESAGP
ncbi:MAG: cyanophycinase, partial [bacterium]